MDNFVFKELSKDDLSEYEKSAKVFNVKKEDIERETISLVSFFDEKFGSSKENVCIATSFNGSDFEVVKKDFYSDYDYIELSDVLSGIKYDRVLIVIRRMSNMILDKVSSSVSCYIYSVIHKDFDKCVIPKNIIGILAKNVVYLSKNLENVVVDVEHRDDIVDFEKKEILDWLSEIRGNNV